MGRGSPVVLTSFDQREEKEYAGIVREAAARDGKLGERGRVLACAPIMENAAGEMHVRTVGLQMFRASDCFFRETKVIDRLVRVYQVQIKMILREQTDC